ncbi:peptidase M24, structural domain-containing protein [Catenaria anguillulae PL171]|uniref:Probable metalloprotease ARX1 n=1 Tax=Catenaria anguillulae PL171 TaxID=765915 RepID=A0A1Y2HB08_9FUNG|nr:peptidase M24, structural domain-containing protein [Catenaria anguillulae PL171]
MTVTPPSSVSVAAASAAAAARKARSRSRHRGSSGVRPKSLSSTASVSSDVDSDAPVASLPAVPSLPDNDALAAMQDNNLADPTLLQKYRLAGQLCNLVMKEVMARTLPGVSVADLCTFGDELIAEKCALAAFPKAKKGISLPTSIAVNNMVAHYAPRNSSSSSASSSSAASASPSYILQVGDLVKVELGVHIDGYAVQAGHTTVLTVDPESPTTGPVADVVAAAHFAAEIVWRMIRPGQQASVVQDAISKLASAFGCAPVQGTFSKQVARWRSDTGVRMTNVKGDRIEFGSNNGENSGEGSLSLSSTTTTSSSATSSDDDVTFGVNEAWDIGVYLASNPPTSDSSMDSPTSATTRDSTTFEPTLYLRDLETRRPLRLPAARKLLSHLTSAGLDGYPVNIPALSDLSMRLGLKECVSQDLLHPLPVRVTAAGTHVAAFRFTVLLLPSGQVLRLSLPHQQLPYVYSERELPAECARMLAVADPRLLKVPKPMTEAEVSPARKRSRSAEKRRKRSRSRGGAAGSSGLAASVVHVDASELDDLESSTDAEPVVKADSASR